MTPAASAACRKPRSSAAGIRPRRAAAAIAVAVAATVAVLVATVASAAVAAPVQRPFVLMISIDGLKPEAVLDAADHGLALPNLRRFLVEGAHARSVRGVLPSLTYPSHVSLLTGAAPARHGVYANTTFDPLDRNDRGWYWYAEDVRVPTLWDAATAAGLTTANVYWPVSVGAHITWNLPQIWRRGTDDDLKLQRALSTPGLDRALGAGLAPYPGGMQETVADDEIRAQYAMRLLESKHPDFMTVYLTGLDTAQHHSGPFSAAANATLERLDAVVGRLRAAALRAAPGRALVCVVSDHGFARVEHDVNLLAAFHEAGLVRTDPSGKIVDWDATPWPAGGSAAVMLAHPEDSATRARVASLLARLAADPANGIARVLDADELARSGGFPGATYLVAFREGYETGLALDGPLVTAPANAGMHGYPPDDPAMRATFLIAGPGVPAGLDLGDIDMRRIAPTIAAALRVRLAGAELAAIDWSHPGG